jgi:hypothetical protein
MARDGAWKEGDDQMNTCAAARAFALASVITLAACSPGDSDPGATVARPGNPFFGTWKTATAQVAPWWTEPGAPPQMNPEFQNTPIVFAAGKSSGPAIVTCKAPVYAIDIVRPRTLFEGHLRDLAADTAALGFTSPEISRMNLSCTDDNKDVSLDFPMVDDNTILLGLDNMIYTLKRQ